MSALFYIHLDYKSFQYEFIPILQIEDKKGGGGEGKYPTEFQLTYLSIFVLSKIVIKDNLFSVNIYILIFPH